MLRRINSSYLSLINRVSTSVVNMEDSSSVCPLPRLDLNHMKSPIAPPQGSLCVLTAPRTLESCARVKVRPVNLLLKRLVEFNDKKRHTLEGSEETAPTEEPEELTLDKPDEVSSTKPLPALETVQEQTSESLSSDSKVRQGESAGQKRDKLVEFSHIKSDSSSEDTYVPPSESRYSCRSGRRLNHGFFLADLRCPPATARQLGRISQDIYKKLSVVVPEKDCKIAGLMLMRSEEERQRCRRKRLEEEQREEVRRKEEVRRVGVELERRRELLRSIRRWQEDMEARRRRREGEEAVRARQEERVAILREERWKRQAEEQRVLRRDRLEAGRRDAVERKQRQEALLREAQGKECVERERELGKAEGREHKAWRTKHIQEKREQRRLRVENQRERLHHTLLLQEARERTQAQEELRRSELEQRLRRWGETRARLLEEQLRELRERSECEEAQIRRVQQRASQKNHERLREKEVLARLSGQRTEEASRHAQEMRRGRARRTRLDNLERELRHRRLREHVLKEEEAQLEHRREAVALKERRRERLRQEQEEVLKRSRHVAQASSYMRERVREQSSSRTFQQMALQSELTARLCCLKL